MGNYQERELRGRGRGEKEKETLLVEKEAFVSSIVFSSPLQQEVVQ